MKDLLKKEILFIVSPAQRWEIQALLEYCFIEEEYYFPRTDIANNYYTKKSDFREKKKKDKDFNYWLPFSEENCGRETLRKHLINKILTCVYC